MLTAPPALIAPVVLTAPLVLMAPLALPAPVLIKSADKVALKAPVASVDSTGTSIILRVLRAYAKN